jgi:hypothetical protein
LRLSCVSETLENFNFGFDHRRTHEFQEFFLPIFFEVMGTVVIFSVAMCVAEIVATSAGERGEPQLMTTSVKLASLRDCLFFLFVIHFPPY